MDLAQPVFTQGKAAARRCRWWRVLALLGVNGGVFGRALGSSGFGTSSLVYQAFGTDE